MTNPLFAFKESLRGLDGKPTRDLTESPQELDGALKQNCIEGKGSREQPKGEEKDSKRIH